MTALFSSLGNLSIDDLVFVDGSTRWAVPGGNGIYSALGMAVWGERPALVTPYGPDYPTAGLESRVDLSHCPRIPRTLRDWGLYEEDGSRQFVFRSSTREWDDFSPRAADVVPGTAAAHVAPLPWDRQADVIRALRCAGTQIISIDLDDRRLFEVPHSAIASLMAEVDLFLPSRQDGRVIFPHATPAETVLALRDLSPETKLIALKCGADGCIAHAAGEANLMVVPAIPVTAVDATGAGDAFCGGTLVGFFRTGDPFEALLHGAVSASFCVETVGVAGLLASTPEEARRRLDALRAITDRRRIFAGARAPAKSNQRSQTVQTEKAVMLQEIALQPAFVRDNIAPMLSFMREILATREPGTLRHGFAIGCGDSFSAGLAARSYMMGATGRFVEPVEALEFSRYLVHDLPPDSFVFGISNSGTVSRTIEGVRLARQRGAWTFAVTVSADSALAQAAETLIRVNAPPNIKEQPDGKRVVTPGSVTYTGSMLGLFVAAIAVGERIGHLDPARAEALIEELNGLPAAMEAADRSVSALAPEIAGSFTPDRKTVILGGGPNYATAYFGMAKWFEALTRPCHTAELEEWAHEQYFFTDEKTDTIILAPPGAARDRALEQARAAREMSSRVVIVGHEGDAEARAASDIYFGMPALAETLTPFVYKLPFEYLSCHIADQQNVAFLGFDNRKRQEVNFRQIFHSAQATAEPEVGV